MRPYHHSSDHTWDGEDPIPVVWIALTLVNGWTNIGGSYPPARFCFLPGRHADNGDPKIELELAVTGGVAGSVIANLGVTFDYNKPPFLVPDGSGGTFPVTVKANGDIVDGVA